MIAFTFKTCCFKSTLIITFVLRPRTLDCSRGPGAPRGRLILADADLFTTPRKLNPELRGPPPRAI